MALKERAVGGGHAPQEIEAPAETEPLYTRYCAAPQPAHPVGEPSFVHALLVATWLGRFIDPLPHPSRRSQTAPRG